MSAHAVLAPSAAPQWGNCSGSVRAQAAHPSYDSQQTLEGTAAHWVCSEVLIARREAVAGRAHGPTSCAEFLGRTAPNGVIIDEKMVEGPEVFVEDVSEVCARFNAWHLLLIEHRVHMPRIHAQNWGTLDVALFLPERGLLFLWDYKHGHRQAPVVGNLQLIDYTEGLCQLYGIDGMADQRIRVVMRIVQPFDYTPTGAVQEWAPMMSELRPYWNRLAVKAYEALENPSLTTGLWCRDCTAVGTCSAARSMGYNLIDLVGAPYEMDAMTGADLALERELLSAALAVAKARVEAIEDELKHRIQAGRGDCALTIEASFGSLDWSVPPAQAAAIAGQFGVDIRKEAVQTPTQAVKAAPAEVRPMLQEVLKQFTHRKPGSTKLVPLKDTRGARAFANRNPSKEYQ